MLFGYLASWLGLAWLGLCMYAMLSQADHAGISLRVYMDEERKKGGKKSRDLQRRMRRGALG